MKQPTFLEREYGGVFTSAKHIHECLTHEQSYSDTNRDLNHCTADLDSVALGGDTTSLR